MKQILQNLGNGETILAEVPCPRRGNGKVLCQTTRTLVSLGTEKMLIDFGKSGWIAKARSQPDQVKKVLQKIKTDGLKTTLETVRAKLDTPIPLGYCNVGRVVEADAAMYEAKSTGRGQVKFFNNTMRKKLKTHADIENDLQHGIEHNEFELYFQPIFTINTSEVIGFEALVRWHHPTKGFVPPNDFIPIAETTGQIINLDLHLLDLAAQHISNWHQQGHRFLKVTVNVSSRHFASLDFVAQIHSIYNKYQLPLGSLCLEITESGLIENLELATQIIEGLSPLKVKLCLDDFGTGYSALGYLHQLPIHILKIDKSFIDHLQDSTNPLVEAILSLAQSLKLEVVAEGIETVEQLTILQSTACDYGQGFLKSKPVTAKEAILLINKPL